ncbi:hypothetical protein PENANT_c103G04422 [Penicillium antarcticum]|uniref:Uncharacterized protein n=1 Tax=Penicillium antarcticum TaxID=416450 RepID=A0A1V6PKA9_9EURO|nr:hypothetical protein PENANT_c103G04422 [Penicillium antarcticum]
MGWLTVYGQQTSNGPFKARRIAIKTTTTSPVSRVSFPLLAPNPSAGQFDRKPACINLSFDRMDSSEYLRILARLDSRAVRAERALSKLEQELSASKAAEKQANEELDHVSRLADIFFELSQKLGGVVDHWLKERGTKGSGQEPESTKVMLDVLLKQLEAREMGHSGENSGDSEGDGTKAAEQCS